MTVWCADVDETLIQIYNINLCFKIYLTTQLYYWSLFQQHKCIKTRL